MKIAVIEPLGIDKALCENLAEKILGKDAQISFYESAPQDEAEIVARAAGQDAVVLANMEFRESVIKCLSNLKFISVAFTGTDHVDVAYCRAHNIKVANCAGYSTNAVAELAVGMAINLCRHIKEGDAAARSGRTREGLVGTELYGKNFGIIGTGAIGLRTAELARAFGCKIYAYSRTFKNIQHIDYVSLPDLMKVSDIISVHVPLNENTRAMIGEKLLRLMKKDAVIINTARGPVIDSSALAAALNSGSIGGAGVDVFDEEPPLSPDNPLLCAKNLLALPHVGFATKEALARRAEIALENIADWQLGVIKNLV